MVFLKVEDVVGYRGGLLDGVHTRFQVGNVNLAGIIGDAVKIVGAVLDFSDPKMHPAQPGAVRTGLDKPQGGLGGVGENKVGVLVRVDLHHPHSVIHEVAVRGLQLPHFISAGGQLRQVDFSVQIGGKFLAIRAAHQLELKSDVGQGSHGDAVHLNQVDARFQRVEKDQLPRLRVARI